ncbi:vitellogenin receptor-like protein-related-related [Holotrichia oblita]|uniref:Vitellogenin receptor-like protein-related-related n=1 Tax=Holotrichia oblita TaxID=644536 RepID=A0ACB9T8C0_HOLOL|nr:vitellogenin receptor-like protein-related-related [Holotrichia oblita]
MDGSHRFVITTTKEIAAIALDIEKDLLVWVEGESIHMCNIDGENQHELWSENKSKITSIAVHLGWLYWLDRTINQLQRNKLSTGQVRQHVLNHAHHILDLVSVSQPDRNHSCSQTNRCSHLCIINGTFPVCACPHGLALADDKRNCVVVPGCSEDHFTCATHEPNSNGCIPLSWRCDGQMDCTDGSDELGCTECRANQFKCRDLRCIEKNQVCDGILNCQDGSDEEACCMKNQFQCPKTDVCIPTSLLCDGVENCADGADELKSVCKEANRLTAQKSSSGIITTVIMTIMSVVVALTALFYLLRRKCNVVEMSHEQTEDLLNPSQSHGQIKGTKIRKTMPDVLGMTTINGSQTSTYDRNNITGASSSTNGSSVGCYPRETLNPPPSPATTAASTRGSSPSSRYRPYRHYRAINQPPPPTPCSTDVCDESDYNYPTRSRYDGGPFPPPPTPRSHCHSESCPPSPSSRSSTYFSPLPPPPSPVASPPRGMTHSIITRCVKIHLVPHFIYLCI